MSLFGNMGGNMPAGGGGGSLFGGLNNTNTGGGSLFGNTNMQQPQQQNTGTGTSLFSMGGNNNAGGLNMNNNNQGGGNSLFSGFNSNNNQNKPQGTSLFGNNGGSGFNSNNTTNNSLGASNILGGGNNTQTSMFGTNNSFTGFNNNQQQSNTLNQGGILGGGGMLGNNMNQNQQQGNSLFSMNNNTNTLNTGNSLFGTNNNNNFLGNNNNNNNNISNFSLNNNMGNQNQNMGIGMGQNQNQNLNLQILNNFQPQKSSNQQALQNNTVNSIAVMKEINESYSTNEVRMMQYKQNKGGGGLGGNTGGLMNFNQNTSGSFTNNTLGTNNSFSQNNTQNNSLFNTGINNQQQGGLFQQKPATNTLGTGGILGNTNTGQSSLYNTGSTNTGSSLFNIGSNNTGTGLLNTNNSGQQNMNQPQQQQSSLFNTGTSGFSLTTGNQGGLLTSPGPAQIPNQQPQSTSLFSLTSNNNTLGLNNTGIQQANTGFGLNTGQSLFSGNQQQTSSFNTGQNLGSGLGMQQPQQTSGFMQPNNNMMGMQQPGMLQNPMAGNMSNNNNMGYGYQPYLGMQFDQLQYDLDDKRIDDLYNDASYQKYMSEYEKKPYFQRLKETEESEIFNQSQRNSYLSSFTSRSQAQRGYLMSMQSFSLNSKMSNQMSKYQQKLQNRQNSSQISNKNSIIFNRSQIQNNSRLRLTLDNKQSSNQSTLFQSRNSNQMSLSQSISNINSMRGSGIQKQFNTKNQHFFSSKYIQIKAKGKQYRVPYKQDYSFGRVIYKCIEMIEKDFSAKTANEFGTELLLIHGEDNHQLILTIDDQVKDYMDILQDISNYQLYLRLKCDIIPVMDNRGSQIRQQQSNIDIAAPPIMEEDQFYDLCQLETEPSMFDLQQMSEEQLKSVKNFKVKNEFGMVHFLKPVDISKIWYNLQDYIVIEKNGIELYPDPNIELPAEGQELNVPHIMRFKNFQQDLVRKIQQNSDEESQREQLLKVVARVEQFCKDKELKPIQPIFDPENEQFDLVVRCEGISE